MKRALALLLLFAFPVFGQKAGTEKAGPLFTPASSGGGLSSATGSAPLTLGLAADALTGSIAVTPTNDGGAIALQTATPGTQQTGNANLTGVSRADTGFIAVPPFDMVGHNLATMPPIDSTVATVGLWAGTNEFSGVKCPLTYWGYNYAPVKTNHPRLFWAVENNFYYVGDGHTYYETFLENYDADATHSRPVRYGFYSGFGSAAFDFDTIGFSLRSGAPIGGQATFAPAFYLAAGTPQVVGIAPNTTIFVHRGVADTSDVLDVRNSSNTQQLAITAYGQITKPNGGTLIYSTDVDEAFTLNLQLGRVSTSAPVTWLSGLGTRFTGIASYPPVTVKGATSQTANLQDWTDVNDVPLASVMADGRIATNRLISLGTAPTVAGTTTNSCGVTGAPSVVGKDQVGIITVGGTSATSCRLTFNIAFANAPACTANAQTTATPLNILSTTGYVDISSNALTPTEKISFVCFGY